MKMVVKVVENEFFMEGYRVIQFILKVEISRLRQHNARTVRIIIKKEASKCKTTDRKAQGLRQLTSLLISYLFSQYCISFVMGLDCIIYLVLTVAIPFKLTYSALKEDKKEEQLALWSHYWGFYVLLSLLQCFLTFLSYQPFKLIILLVHVWLYAEDYQGALFVSQLIKKKIEQFGLQQHINHLAQTLSIAKVFDSSEEASASSENLKKD